MHTQTIAPSLSLPHPGRLARYSGRALSGLASLFLAFDAVGKLLRVQQVLEGTVALGYSTRVVVPLGIVLLASVALYVIPRTQYLGALLLTGYLGGAIASHVRVGDPVFTHTLFPVYVALFVWGGLFLRDRRLRALFSLSRASEAVEP